MNWTDLRLGQLHEFNTLASVTPTDLVELYDRDCILLSMITGKSEDHFLSMKVDEFAKWRKELYVLLSKEAVGKFTPIFKINGRKFNSIVDPKKTSVSQLADIHLLQITETNYYQQLPCVVAIFAIEKTGWKFWKKKLSFTEKVELFKRELSADVGLAIGVFFCKASKELEPIIENFFQKQMEAMNSLTNQTLKEINLSLNDGDGSAPSTNSRTGMYRRKNIITK